MDLENQARIKELCETHGKDNLVLLIGGAEAEAAGLAAETVSVGDPTFAGPLAGVPLGLKAYHIVEVKEEIDSAVYEEQVAMMEMVIDVDAIVKEMNTYRS
jgi:betaine reductase